MEGKESGEGLWIRHARVCLSGSFLRVNKPLERIGRSKPGTSLGHGFQPPCRHALFFPRAGAAKFDSSVSPGPRVPFQAAVLLVEGVLGPRGGWRPREEDEPSLPRLHSPETPSVWGEVAAPAAQWEFLL